MRDGHGRTRSGWRRQRCSLGPGAPALVTSVEPPQVKDIGTGEFAPENLSGPIPSAGAWLSSVAPDGGQYDLRSLRSGSCDPRTTAQGKTQRAVKPTTPPARQRPATAYPKSTASESCTSSAPGTAQFSPASDPAGLPGCQRSSYSSPCTPAPAYSSHNSCSTHPCRHRLRPRTPRLQPRLAVGILLALIRERLHTRPRSPRTLPASHQTTPTPLSPPHP